MQPARKPSTSSLCPPFRRSQHTNIRAPDDEGKRAVGTPDYLAPELLLGTGHGAGLLRWRCEWWCWCWWCGRGQASERSARQNMLRLSCC
eukprot:343345-Chlamydomonas_euryale.AAC.2